MNFLIKSAHSEAAWLSQDTEAEFRTKPRDGSEFFAVTQSTLRKVAFVGDYPPRKCGIATFTHDMYRSISDRWPELVYYVIPVNDRPQGYEYGSAVRFEISEQDLESYLRAADYLNFANVDVVSIQHEYGIFGGPAGSHLLGLIRNLQMPVITTLHTVLRDPNPDQHRVLVQLVELSARVVVMTDRARAILQETYAVPAEKVDVIAHGIPETDFTAPDQFKELLGFESRMVALTFGLLSPNKGIEHMLRALPEIVAAYPSFVYIILGATHPELLRQQGEGYRLSLERMARKLGVERHVIFYNRFVELDELTNFIQAADLYVTPYLNPAQITSGTLAYSFGCGKAIVSTPYWHAEDLLAEGRGVLVPFADSEALAREICSLLADEPRRSTMRRTAYSLGREMVWSRSAEHYMNLFQKVRQDRHDHSFKRPPVRTLAEKPVELPTWRFDHLESLCDSVGIFQHATYTIPNIEEGYCTDDNARALLFTAMMSELGRTGPILRRVTSSSAAFLQAAFNTEHQRFRNFLGFDRRWCELTGSEECHGRALWGLGACVGRSRRTDIPHWAAALFERGIESALHMTSPRAWAFSLLGIHEYSRRFKGDRLASQTRDALVELLMGLFQKVATSEWCWFEDILTYDNARLSQSLIVSGHDCDNTKALEIGLSSLSWLVQTQKAPEGHFRAIGCHGFHRRGGQPARFDQQPIEACATVSACLDAYRVNREHRWINEARTAFEWFLGRNDLGFDLYDPSNGGCFDGLQEDRVNRNQGAESTLAFLLSLADMNLIRDFHSDHYPERL